MKRSALKRGPKPLARGKALSRGSRPKRAKRLRKVGKRGEADRLALAAVRLEVRLRAGGKCERCRRAACVPLDLHHRLRRSQGGKHEAANLALLGRRCHDEIHAGSADAAQWIVTRRGAA